MLLFLSVDLPYVTLVLSVELLNVTYFYVTLLNLTCLSLTLYFTLFLSYRIHLLAKKSCIENLFSVASLQVDFARKKNK
jgi:hypothetical protein